MIITNTIPPYLNKVFQFFWHLHRKLFIAMVISLAALSISLRLTALYFESHPHIIQNYLETELQHSISFDNISVDIDLLYPSVAIKNFAIKKPLAGIKSANNNNESGKKNILSFNSVNIQFNVLHSIFYNEIIINELLLDGSQLLIQRESVDELSIAGIKIKLESEQNTSKTSSPLQLLNKKNLIITNSKIMFVDKLKEYSSFVFTNFNFSLKNKGIKHQLKLQTKFNRSQSGTRTDSRFEHEETQVNILVHLMGKLDKPEQLSGKIYGLINKLNYHNLSGLIKKDKLQLGNYQLNHLLADTKIWANIKKGQLHSVKGQLAINESELARIDNKKSINFYDLMTNFKFSSDVDQLQTDIVAKDWLLDIYDLNFSVGETDFIDQRIQLKNVQEQSSHPSQIALFVNKLHLQQLTPIASFFLTDAGIDKIIKTTDPQGKLENIIASISLDNTFTLPTLQTSALNDYQVQADLVDVSINASIADSIPKIKNLSAEVIFNNYLGQAKISSQNMELHIDSLFRKPWPIKQMAGEVFWQKEGNSWLLGADKFLFENPHLSINTDFKLWFLENKKTFLDLSGFFSDVNVIEIPLYLPSKVMSKGLFEWLDNAFDAGTATDGGVLFRGQLERFPFADNSGVLDISFNTEKVLLDYQKNWPKIKNIDSLIQFTEKGMSVDAQHSEIFSAVSKNIQADIEDYLKSILTVKGDVNTTIKDALKYLKQSELVSNDVLEMLDAEDNIKLNLDLIIPTEEGEADTKIVISLNDADYYPPGFERKQAYIRHIKGDVIVHNEQINAKKLQASIMNSPAEFSIKSAAHLSKKNHEPFISILADSRISLQQLEEFDLLPKRFDSIKEHLSGGSKVSLAVKLPNEEQGFSFNIESNLIGLSSDLPLPFKKTKTESSPFKLSYEQLLASASSKNTTKTFTQLSTKNTTKETTKSKAKSSAATSAKSSYFNLDYSDQISLALLLNTSAKEFDVLKGNIVFSEGRAKLPEKNVFRISGSVSETPMEEWSILLEQFNKDIVDVAPVKKKTFIPIELALSQLILPEFNGSAYNQEKAAQHAKTNTQGKIKVISLVNPGQFPLVNGSIQSLMLGKTDLGKFTIQSSRLDKDIIFDVLRLEGDYFSFEGDAGWHHWYNIPEVNLAGKLKIPSMEKLLEALKFDKSISHGKGKVSGFLKWKGAPSDISRKSVAGNIRIDVQKGSFVDAKPGTAGRILGLLNLNKLARRVTLDFSDVKDKGFSFDKISGDFRLMYGNAYTENLHVLSPSADLSITGRTGMVAEDFDQQVVVIPEISATMPLAGAAIGGPAGAAIGWLGQKLLGKEINKLSTFNYTVMGSWLDPKIEREKQNKGSKANVKKLFSIEQKKIQQKEQGKSLNNATGIPIIETPN